MIIPFVQTGRNLSHRRDFFMGKVDDLLSLDVN